MDKTKISQLKKFVDAASLSIDQARTLLSEYTGDHEYEEKSGAEFHEKAVSAGSVNMSGGVRIIEGVFDGQNMVGPDGKQYSVPANYASKSKLVEGDMMKLTIDRTGSFIYKQIGPVERDRKTGVVMQDPETDEYRVLAEGKMYHVLLASVTYFKGDPGDEAIILVPQGKDATWAAVENIIKELSNNFSPERKGALNPPQEKPQSVAKTEEDSGDHQESLVSELHATEIPPSPGPKISEDESPVQLEPMPVTPAQDLPALTVEPATPPSLDDEFERI